MIMEYKMKKTTKINKVKEIFEQQLEEVKKEHKNLCKEYSLKYEDPVADCFVKADDEKASLFIDGCGYSQFNEFYGEMPNIASQNMARMRNKIEAIDKDLILDWENNCQMVVYCD